MRKAKVTRMWANAQRDGRPPNIGGAVCSMPQSLADAHYKSAVQGFPKLTNRSQPLVRRSSPYYEDM